MQSCGSRYEPPSIERSKNILIEGKDHALLRPHKRKSEGMTDLGIVVSSAELSVIAVVTPSVTMVEYSLDVVVSDEKVDDAEDVISKVVVVFG